MTATSKALAALCQAHPKFLKKGGLCVALVVTEAARDSGLPLDPKKLRTSEGGQVAGLGKTAVQRILAKYGINKILAEEGGRTSRGSLGLMEAYAACLNKLHQSGELDLDEAESWWVGQVRRHFASEGPQFRFDPAQSVRANIETLLTQAKDLQAGGGGTAYVGAMLQHLVGAKLDLVLGPGKVAHHGFSVADHSTARKAEFEVGKVALHITTHPTEALIRKCQENLGVGLRPVIVTWGDGVSGGLFLLKNAGFENRVDILDIGQFLTANVYERSLFQAEDCKHTLKALLERYNEIVSDCETDPGLKIRL